MNKHQTFTPTQPSFRNQLLTFTAVGLLVFSLMTSLLITWLVSGMAQHYMTSNGQQVVAGLAEQSILSTVTQSGENAKAAIEQVRRFPEVSAAQIILPSGEILIEQGDFKFESEKIRVKTLQNIQNSIESHLVFENELFWIFASPIKMDESKLSEEEEENYAEVDEDDESSDARLLGFAVVKMSKSTLVQANETIVTYALIIGLAAVLVFTIFINYGLSALTRPLLTLAKIMLSAEKTGEHLRADIEGPKEVQRMAHAYNSMMEVLDAQDEELRLHRDQLEAEVDIRTRELIEARDTALTANRHKSEFLANMTHELRTPIQAIIGYVDLVKEELEMEGLPELQDDLDKVTKNSRRLLSLINSVLDFAKVEAGKMDVSPETIAICTIMLNVKETILPLVERNHNQLQIIGDDIQQQIYVDREKLEQVLVNLLSNATKFTEKGTINFNTSIEADYVTFEVKDTGIGMLPENVKGIFDEFQQVDGSQARKFQGTGLGLAICKRFCELIDADISVKSKLGVGSTFTIKVPLNQGDSHLANE
jgi:signal transduction histidine kinase